MIAEIISIGSELTSGQNLDTNSQWLSRRLSEIGIAVGYHTTVADDFAANVDVFRAAARRAGLVIATGGLGPTQDDLTREALAKAADVELVFHEPSLTRIREMFAKRSRTMPERNKVQAMVPASAEALQNDRGTAPGIWMQLGDAWIAVMPGVPSEMFAMFETHVKPRLLSIGLGGGVLVQRKINCFGAGESAIEEKVADLTRRDYVPEVGITVSDAVISLRIIAKAANAAEAQAQIEPVERTIRERLGDLVFGVENEDLEDAVVPLLAERKHTIATAESITAGLVASRLGRVPGVSAWLLGGIVAYHNDVKINLLGVPAEMIREHGAVSPQVAEAMAAGCRTRFGVDLAVSTTGIAGPGGATPMKPVGLVYVGLAHAGGTKSVQWNWAGMRREIQSRSAHHALNLVRLHLLRNRTTEARR
jgi:nicotinamide-nucleotide amidase